MQIPGMGYALLRLQFCLAATGAVLASRGPAQPIAPEPLPELRIPGFHFPESEATITGWLTAMSRETPAAASAAAKIQLHGWGLWTALTAETAQRIDGQSLRVFETWLSADDLAPDPGSPAALSPARARRRTGLRPLNQFRVRPEEHDAVSDPADDPNPINRVMGFVKFDPTAAEHIARQRLLSTGALDALLDGGAQQIPVFPTTTIVAKPVFQIIKSSDLIDGRYYALKVWPGPPETPRAFPPALWPGCVWLDLLGGGEGRGAIDEAGLSDGSSRTAETTYPLASIMHYRLSAADAAGLNQAKPATASAGDTAILVAMHMAGREIARWTWQTFWWTPTPDDPHEPSSGAIASRRPAQLRGPARNYAMAIAYALFAPDQPYVGGENSGAPLYAYNPWIEARFAPADLPDSQPLLLPDGRTLANNVGVQTNCLSCHARASYNPHLRATAPRFAGLRYTDLGDAQFVGTLQVDFLWSIARHAR